MMAVKFRLCLFVGLMLCALGSDLYAEVTRIEIISRTDVAKGVSMGSAGAYEIIVARVYYAVDPRNAHNISVVDLDKAPRNARGLVEFSGDLYIIKPKDMSRGNGAVLYAVSNRGNGGVPGRSRLAKVPDVGDDFLMRHGFTVVWSGWQFDLPKRPGLFRIDAPIPTDNGKLIEGLVRTDFITYKKEFDYSLGHLYMVPYPAIEPNGRESVLTVRDKVDGQRKVIPRSQWSFARVDSATGKVVPDSGRIYLKTGFEPGRIYEAVYRSHNPPVSGVGFTSVRDLISYFKYDPNAILKTERAYAFGTSQSGRYLREFIYRGWNADENNRKVFDGIIPNVAAQGNQGMNHRFSQQSRGNFPALVAFFTPTNLFPFTDIDQTDPVTGETDGMLHAYAKNPSVMPKIFYPNSSNEYWGRAAAVIHTTVDGKADVPIPDNVRFYMYAGTQHGPGPFPPKRDRGQYMNNPNDFIWGHRALLITMDRWVRDGIAPPPSKYPRISDGTLVAPSAVNFPKIPGVSLPQSVPATYRVEFGERYKTLGIIDWEPPRVGPPFPILQAQVDKDGNELAGVRLPDIVVPLATYTGWNLRAKETGAPTELAGLSGSYIPFPRTKAERERTGDPRLSIEERYKSRAEYLGLYAEAAMQLIKDGYLLGEDLPGILEEARMHWDWVTSPSRN
jgi:hypothetical protein